MSTLLLRLAGPMQSWGLQSRYLDRDTGLEPSKSGVIGLLCAALGRTVTEPLVDLAKLTMGVRVDREGVPQADFQTTRDVFIADGSGISQFPTVSTRHFLSDAMFLVGLESDDEAFLIMLAKAVEHPKWQLYLGRKSYTPSIPVFFHARPAGFEGPAGVPSVVNLSLRDALLGYPLLCKPRPRQARLRVVIEINEVTNMQDSVSTRRDVPVSFAERKFSSRLVRTEWIDTPRDPAIVADIINTQTR